MNKEYKTLKVNEKEKEKENKYTISLTRWLLPFKNLIRNELAN